MSPGGVVPPSAAPSPGSIFGVGGVGSFGGGGGGGLTERMLAAKAVAGLLGVLTFGSGAAGAGIAAGSLAPPAGVDPSGSLKRATSAGELCVTVPWVLAFFRFLPWVGSFAQAELV